MKKINLKICFVASGGGHLRQLLQLEQLMQNYSYYFVTEKTSLGESLLSRHITFFVPHFAFGQRKTDGILKFIWSGIANSFVSTIIFFRQWPDIIITSGAGAAFCTVLLAYLFRKKIIYLESIARVNEVSLFGKLVSRLAGLSIVQWPSMLGKLDNAKYCSPLLIEEAIENYEREGTLVTVGTVLPFDRMVKGVEKLHILGKLQGPISAQIGNSHSKFEGMEVFKSCSFEDLNSMMLQVNLVVCHGGSGSILGALKAGAHVVAMARLESKGEHYDDHQKEITQAFEDMGLISVARDENDLERAIQEALSRKRHIVNINPSEYINVIQDFIENGK